MLFVSGMIPRSSGCTSHRCSPQVIGIFPDSPHPVGKANHCPNCTYTGCYKKRLYLIFRFRSAQPPGHSISSLSLKTYPHTPYFTSTHSLSQIGHSKHVTLLKFYFLLAALPIKCRYLKPSRCAALRCLRAGYSQAQLFS